MADPITTLPVPTKNILELDDAAAFDGSEYAEVVQGGNSRKFKPVNAIDAELLGAPTAASPDFGDVSNRIATTESVKAELDALGVTPDTVPPPTDWTLTTRTQLDQDGKVALFVIAGWTEPVGAPERWNYELRYTKDGADPDSRVVGNTSAKIRVESGSTYVFRVRTISKDDKSDWLVFDPITPLKKTTVPPSPTGLTANGRHKRVVLRWEDPRVINTDFYDYKSTWIYRATSNNYLAASKIDEVSGTLFVDDNRPNDTEYWYWIVHVDTSRNQSNKHPTSNTAGVYAKTDRITDDDTDDDAPGVPTNLVLTPRVERTDDGNLEVNLIITWDAPAGGLHDKGEYVVHITESTTGDIHTAVTDANDRKLKYRGVRTNRTYDVKVRARKGGGKKSDWTATVQVTIAKKADYNTAVPSGLTVTTEHKRNILSWDELTGIDALDHKYTKIYRSATNDFTAATVVGRIRDSAFIDGKVANAQSFWYWIAHVDRSMNEGPRYPAGPANNNGISPGASPRILEGDTDQTAPSVPAGLALVQTTVDVDEDGKTDIAVKATWNAATGAKDFELEITQGSDVTYVKAKGRSHIFRAKSNKLYSVKVAGISFNETQSAFSSAVTITPVKKSAAVVAPTALAAIVKLKGIRLRWSASTEADYKHTNIYRHTADVIGSAVLIDSVKGTAFTDHDALVAGTTYYYWVSHVDTSGNISAKYPAVNGTTAVYGLVLDADVDQTAPGTPTSLAVVQLTKDTDGGDGRIRINGRATWSAPAGGVTVRRYIIEVDDGENVEYLYTTAARRAVKIKDMVIGRTYTVKVSAESISGVEGAQTAGVGLTPTAKTAAPGDPSSIAIVVKAKQNRIKWTAPADKDLKGFNVYFNSVNNSAAATLLDFTAATKYDDTTERTAGDDCYYWVESVNRSGVVGATRVAASNNPVDARVLVDTDLDQTPPGTPTSLAVAQLTKDTDGGDGRIRINGRATWNAPAGGVAVKRYIIEVDDGENTEYLYTSAARRAVKIKDMVVDRTYNVKVSAESVAGVEGAQTSAVALTPTAKTAAPGNVTSVAIVVKAKFNRIKWTAPSDKDILGYNVYFNSTNNSAAASLLDFVQATKYDDTTERTAGDVCYYWVETVNRSRVVSSARTAASNNPQNARAANTADIGTGAVIDSHVTGQFNSDRLPVDFDVSNLVKNPSFKGGLMKNWVTSAWSAVARASAVIAGAPSAYVAQVTPNGSYLSMFVGVNGGVSEKFEVSGGELFSLRSFVAASAAATNGVLSISCRFSNASGDGQYQYGGVSQNIATISAAAAWIEQKGLVTVPATVNSLPTAFMELYVEVNNAATTGIVGATKVRVRRASENDMLGPGAVSADKTIQTLPDTPTGLSIGPGSIEVTEDGIVQAYASVSWSAVSTGVAFSHYRIKQIQTATSEATFYDVAAGTLTQAVPVKTGKAYTYQVATVSFNNKESNFSSTVSYTRPKKTGAVPNVGTVTASPNKKRIKLDWTDVDDDANPDYRITYIYRNTVNTTPTLGSTTPLKKTKAGYYIDDNVVTGTNYYYWVVHKDQSGNFGALSSVVGPVTSGGNEVTSFSDLTGTVGSTQFALGTISIDKLISGDLGNRMENPHFGEGNKGWLNQSGGALPSTGVSIVTGDAANAFTGSNYLAFTVGAAGSIVAKNANVFPVIPNEKYLCIIAWKTTSDLSHNVVVRIRFMTADKSTLVSAPTVVTMTPNSTTYGLTTTEITVPATAVYAHLDFVPAGVITLGTAYVGFASVRRRDAAELTVDGGITHIKTDPTAPVTPTGLAIAAGALEVMDDGTIDAQADVTWNAVVTGVTFTHYRVKQTQVSNSKVRFFDVPAGTLTASVPVKTGKSYNYQVATVTFNNKEGTYSAAVAYTRPKKTGTVPAAGTITVSSNKKRIKLDWTDVDDDTNPDYRITYIYRNTVNTVPTLGTTSPYKRTKAGYFIDDNVTTGTNYYYWIAHKDQSGNFGTISATAGPVASGGNEVTSFSDLTGAATSAQLAAGRSQNLLINTNAALYQTTGMLPMYWKENVDSNAVTTITVSAIGYAWAPYGERVFVLEQTNGTSGSFAEYVQTDQEGNDRKIPVKVGSKYEFHFLSGAHRCTGFGIIRYFNISDVQVGSDVVTNSNTGGSSGGQLLAGYAQLGVITPAVPATAAYAKIYIRKDNTNAGQANSYLFWTHAFFAEAGANQTEYSPWAENGNLISTADMVDSRAPSVPTGLAVTFGSLEVDEDGKSVAYAIASWTQPATTVPATVYRVKVTQNSNSEVRIFETENLNFTFEVKTGKQYDVQVRGISAFEKMSAYTSIVSYTRPKKSGLPNPPTAVSIVQKANGNMVKWTAPADKDIAYYNIYVGTTSTAGSASKTGQTDATNYLDQEVRTVGTNYYYFVTSVDRSGNESSTRVAASNNPVAYRLTLAADTDNTVLTAPTSLALALNYADIDGDGIVDTAYKATWASLAGAARYEVEVSKSTTPGGLTMAVVENIVTTQLLAAFKVNVAYVYSVRVRAFNVFDVVGAWSSDVNMPPVAVKALTLDPPPAIYTMGDSAYVGVYWSAPTGTPDAKDYAYTVIETSITGAAGTWGERGRTNGTWWTDTTLEYWATSGSPTGYWYRIAHVDKRGNKTAYAATTSAKIPIGIDYGNVVTAGLSARNEAFTLGGYGSFGNSQQTIQTINVVHSTGADFVVLMGYFKNTTGAQRSFDVVIETGGGTNVARLDGVVLNDGQAVSLFGIHGSPGGTNTNFDLKVTVATGTGNNVSNRRLVGIAHKR